MAQKLREYFNKYLTADGQDALLDRTLAQMVAPRIRDKYRNPPAHTRYVRLETALECRDFVEKNVFVLSGYVV